MYPPGFSVGMRGRRTYQPVPAAASAPVAPPSAKPGGAVSPMAGIAPTLNFSNPATPPPTVSPVAAAPAVTPQRLGFGAAVGAGANKVGGAVAGLGKKAMANPLATLNVIQGVGGVLSYATAKAPAPLTAPPAYAPPSQGPQGMETTSYEKARGDLKESQSVASGADSSDVATNAVTRLLAQRQTSAGLAGLATQNNQVYQQDRARFNSEARADYGINFQNQERFKENKFNYENNQYNARRTQAAAQVQGAIDSIGAGVQQKQQGEQLRLEASNRKVEGNVTTIHNSLASAATQQQRDALLEQLKAVDTDGTTYRAALARYGTPVKLAGGGSIPNGSVKFTTNKAAGGSSRSKGAAGTRAGAEPASVAIAHRMGEEFSRHITTFSKQARDAFDRSMQTAIRLRTIPHGSTAGRR